MHGTEMITDIHRANKSENRSSCSQDSWWISRSVYVHFRLWCDLALNARLNANKIGDEEIIHNWWVNLLDVKATIANILTLCCLHSILWHATRHYQFPLLRVAKSRKNKSCGGLVCSPGSAALDEDIRVFATLVVMGNEIKNPSVHINKGSGGDRKHIKTEQEMIKMIDGICSEQQQTSN